MLGASHSQGRGGENSDEVKRGVDAICGWLERFDVLVVGPGLGRDPWVQQTVTQARVTVWPAACSVSVRWRRWPCGSLPHAGKLRLSG